MNVPERLGVSEVSSLLSLLQQEGGGPVRLIKVPVVTETLLIHSDRESPLPRYINLSHLVDIDKYGSHRVNISVEAGNVQNLLDEGEEGV